MPRKKILLVDDSGTTLMMEKMILGTSDYDLVTASDGVEAVAKATAEQPDLILLDVVMPKMNGFEACQRIREIDSLKKTPVIMVTTRGEAENVQQGFEIGCTDYVTKPINSLELLTKVRHCLDEES